MEAWGITRLYDLRNTAVGSPSTMTNKAFPGFLAEYGLESLFEEWMAAGDNITRELTAHLKQFRPSVYANAASRNVALKGRSNRRRDEPPCLTDECKKTLRQHTTRRHVVAAPQPQAFSDASDSEVEEEPEPVSIPTDAKAMRAMWKQFINLDDETQMSALARLVAQAATQVKAKPRPAFFVPERVSTRRAKTRVA